MKALPNIDKEVKKFKVQLQPKLKIVDQVHSK